MLGDTNIPEDFSIQIDYAHRGPESKITILGVTPDSKFDSDSHIPKICKEAYTKDWMHFPEYLSILLKSKNQS